jgi:hypothetical protein
MIWLCVESVYYNFKAKHKSKTERDGGKTVLEFLMYSYVYNCLFKHYTLINAAARVQCNGWNDNNNTVRSDIGFIFINK